MTLFCLDVFSDNCPAQMSVFLDNHVLQMSIFSDNYPAQLGVYSDGQPAQMGVVLDNHLARKGVSLDNCLAQMGVASTICLVQPGVWLVGQPAHIGVFLANHSAQSGILDGWPAQIIDFLKSKSLQPAIDLVLLVSSFVSELYIKMLNNFVQILSCTVFKYNDIQILCRKISLYCKRNCMRKTDFWVHLRKLRPSSILLSCATIYVVFVCCFYAIIYIRLYLVSYQQSHKKWLPSNNVFYSGLGGGCSSFSFQELEPYLIENGVLAFNAKFKFHGYILCSKYKACPTNKSICACIIPWSQLLTKLKVSELRDIAACHGLFVPNKMRSSQIQALIEGHICNSCSEYVSLFERIENTKNARNLIAVKKYQEKRGEQHKLSNLAAVIGLQKGKKLTYKASHLVAVKKHQKKLGYIYKTFNLASVKKHQKMQGNVYKASHNAAVKMQKEKKKEEKYIYIDKDSLNQTFPPPPPSFELYHEIISNACKEMHINKITETGCAVCGKLTLVADMVKLSESAVNLDILVRPGVTRKERVSSDQPIKELRGPVMDNDLDSICMSCHETMDRGYLPTLALANGKWLGKVPEQLTGLTYAEQLLISRVRHNYCIVRVASGRRAMCANAISFANPIPKVYDILPIPMKELDEILAFIYTGPCMPTEKDFERTPLLVRRNKVKTALEWLKLNHCDYHDLEISQRNLNEYPEKGIPVVVDYRKSFSNKNPEATAINDNEEEEGTESGKCPFVVQGLIGEEYSSMTADALKTVALKHLKDDNGKVLAIGHASEPESIYSNPQLFPKMLPWLFPYGLGGIGNNLQDGHISDIAHKRQLLMYHDKRFQMDPHFPLIALNHEQIKQCTSAGYLLAEKSKFENISKRLMEVDVVTLTTLSKRMEDGERVMPETDEEKLCFQLIKDLDHVGGNVKGSVTSKKYNRNELWSLISFKGAPSWFVTFAPADNKHPICLYYADTKTIFQPELKRDYAERYRLIANNPVASARFFHFMCQIFIKHVLGVDEEHNGIFGNTSAYYGTVEQQGRLTLHLHLLLWISGCLSPQEIRNRIMDPDSDFQQRMVEYLEGVHVGEFLTGSMTDVKASIEKEMASNNYRDPTETLPEMPPPLCTVHEDKSLICCCLHEWWKKLKHTVDDLIFRSNIHRCAKEPCEKKSTESSKINKKKSRRGCINKDGKCKARFPRPLFDQTEVDPMTGALNMKKHEPWINTLSPIVTYLLRCNSDVTSLLSGTAIKAIVAYITDYVTKPGLKTYSIFDAIRGVIDRNTEMLQGSITRKEKARRLITKIVNSLTAKMEIGSPMASLYLLGNPDHYTSHTFKTFYWRSYVAEVKKDWPSLDDVEVPEKVVLQKNKFGFVGVSPIYDYIYRPIKYRNKSLYEWIQMAKRIKKRSEIKPQIVTECEDELDLIKPKVQASSSIQLLMSGMALCDDADDADEMNIKDGDLNTHIIDETLCDLPSIGKFDSATDSDTDTDTDANADADLAFETDAELDISTSKHGEFLRDHPLCDTHFVKFEETKKDVVPNFVGGSLPRRDCGDREYYCLTMLTLFKPWRNGKDLKSDNYSWDETFTSHKFTHREMDLMANFNLRYECNDARDDFSAQLKSGNTSANVPQWMQTGMGDIDDVGEIDDIKQGDDFGDDEDLEDKDYGINKYSELSPYGKILKSQMVAAENSIRNAGWLDDSPDGLYPTVTQPLKPDIDQSGSQWKVAVQNKRQEVLANRRVNIPKQKKNFNSSFHDPNENDVKVVDQSYLRRNFKAELEVVQNLVESTVANFSLNIEQERAFRIVANHSTTFKSDQLKMYLGGIGGTGKSQVIKALRQFFEQRGEAHRFLILGPTGTSAALLGGSTYHSTLGLFLTNITNNPNILQIKANLDGVDYIFIDEISMVSCRQLYAISARLSQVFGVCDEPFGGINMLFAGDFAQLPPVGGSPLYSGSVGTQVDSALHIHSQEAAIGKALWHQVTTVVILRENMRQKTQTVEDACLRAALLHMRYGGCTEEDITFLRTRIAGKRSEQPKVSSKDFRNVAVICGVHTQKDAINQLGCERFAADTDQKLVHFYSIDRWGKDKCFNGKKKSKLKHIRTMKTTRKVIHETGEISYDDQLEIWKLHPGRTGHMAGKLSLCIGMPVIIRNNYATELCITNGQEGFVVGWQSCRGPHGKLVLDTLFIRLDNPPQSIKLDGLVENVVPIVKVTQTITCKFLNDLTESVERQQVLVQPNFAMTAHAAQGKTRPYNVVHLNSCRDHMAYYTALSRSASAAGTIIIQGFDKDVITKGCSGYLRQEFREQEILDDITRLQYDGKLPPHINGHLRNTLVDQYQQWKSTAYVPKKTDIELSWSKGFMQLPKTGNSPMSNTMSTFIPAKGSLFAAAIKRKNDETESSEIKKQKMMHCSIDTKYESICPLGIVWDGVNYSCAYDSLFVILYDIWFQNPLIWSKRFKSGTEPLGALVDGFAQVLERRSSIEAVRDSVRYLLHRLNPHLFPTGHVGTCVGDLITKLFSLNRSIAFFKAICSTCGYEKPSINKWFGCMHYVPSTYTDSTSSWLNQSINCKTCPRCTGSLSKYIFYTEEPDILIFAFDNFSKLQVSHKIQLVVNEKHITLDLSGLIYFGQFHYTSCITSRNGNIWYHDGITTKNKCVLQGQLKNISNGELNFNKEKELSFIIYTKQ
jgi:ATP-dependent exoDNAse (exonuclease V), alpha subunit - helicase superfamily I member